MLTDKIAQSRGVVMTIDG